MCALLREETLEGEVTKVYQCGASLVGPGTVLTAAHCVDSLRGQPARLVVRCGEWDTQAANEPSPHQDRRVEEVIVHPDFSPRNLRNDFALLFTEQEFVLSPHVDTVCLPEPGQTFDLQTCTATGWGKDKFGAEGSYQVGRTTLPSISCSLSASSTYSPLQVVMKEVELPVVEHAACEAGLRRTRLGRRFRLHPSFLCAGGEPGVDTCTGDGGSPLVCAEGPGGALVQVYCSVCC
jgi:secreted trypsin-like serine protease